jgi:hypothetical protein
MAIAEDLGVFLEDFGVTVVTNSGTFLGIFDSPTDEAIAGGMVLSNDYMLTGSTEELGSLQDGASITVAGVAYTVRQDPTLISDGMFCMLRLSKNADGDTITYVYNGDWA